MRRTILLTLAFLLLSSAPALARPEDGEKRAKDKWEKQRAEERKERQRKLRDAFKGKSPQEQEEILRKLKELEGKAKRDRLREKREQYEKFERRLLASLSAPARARYDEIGKGLQVQVILHIMRRSWEAGAKRFRDSLTDVERKELDGLSGKERLKRIRKITDRRALEAQTGKVREEIDAMVGPEREKRLGKLRMDYIIAKMKQVEREVVFPEADVLLRKSKKEIQKALKWGPPDDRPHHRFGFRFPDRELHELLHKIPEKHWKAADEKFLRIVTKVRDGEERKKEFEKLKGDLRKLIAD